MNIELKINDISLERVSDFCFLGLIINEHLSWKSHIDKISNKISKFNGILNKLKHFVPKHILRSLYCCLIQSQMNYCILAWGSDSNRLAKNQKKSVRIITCSRYNAHTEPLFKRLRIIKINDLFELNLLKFYQKLLNGRLPTYFDDFELDTMEDIHEHDTRNKTMIPKNVTRTKSAQNSVRNELPLVLNNTDALITAN